MEDKFELNNDESGLMEKIVNLSCDDVEALMADFEPWFADVMARLDAMNTERYGAGWTSQAAERFDDGTGMRMAFTLVAQLEQMHHVAMATAYLRDRLEKAMFRK